MVVYTHKSLPLWGRWQPVRVVLSAADSKSVDCRGQSHLYSTDEVQYNVKKVCTFGAHVPFIDFVDVILFQNHTSPAP